MITPKLDETFLKKHRLSRIVGIDEAGRGAWAGPVAVGYFTYRPGATIIPGVNDSKKLSPKKRERAYQDLANSEDESGVLLGSVEQINSEGLGNTITAIIQRIIMQMANGETLFLVDGQFKADFGENVIKQNRADTEFYSVAAASILAKVERDLLLSALEQEFPGYGFMQHKGYGTKKHIDAISRLGQLSVHRTGFKPLHRSL